MFKITAIAALAATCGYAAAAPDVICGALTDVNYYGSVGDVSAYAIGTTACNKGTVELDWIDNTPNHPVISVNIFRLHDGRMEQLGVTFVKHSFAVINGNACGFGCSGGAFDALGVGCSDPYGAGLNGDQTGLGPRSEINAVTGDFVYPYTSRGQSGNAIFKRSQVKTADMGTPGALYFVEGQYIIKDENGHLNSEGEPTSFNNVSYKRLSGIGNSANTTGGTIREQSALMAWQAHGNGVNQPDPSITVVPIWVPGENGKIEVASRAIDQGDGTWRYEYAVHNQNSHKSVGSFSVPVSSTTTNHYFNDVDYHSSVDANLSGADWAPAEGSDAISWACEPAIVNSNANAIRWGTTYNFSFVTDAAPTTGDVSIGMWRDPNTTVTATLTVPSAGLTPCNEADINADGELDFFDVSEFLDLFGAGDPSIDFDKDGEYTFFDVSAFLDFFGAGCP